jgi:hypothetical protein
VVDRAGEPQPAVAGPQLEHGAAAVGARALGHERALAEALAAAGVVAVRGRGVREQLRGELDLGAVGSMHLVAHRGEVRVGERREPGRAHDDAPPLPREELDLAREHAAAHVQRALVADERRAGEVEALAIHGQADDRGVGARDDRLARARQAERVLGVDDRPRLVEAVDDRARIAGREALLRRAAQAEEAVADREHGLERGTAPRGVAALDDPPLAAGAPQGLAEGVHERARVGVLHPAAHDAPRISAAQVSGSSANGACPAGRTSTRASGISAAARRPISGLP